MQMEGTGGQSFGAFLASGITLYLIGDANDYTGKGLSRRARRGAPEHRLPRRRHAATSSSATPCSTAPPAARPSSAAWPASASRCACRAPRAVVEGTGDHGCEYMTGGTVVVLGKTGRNFAAGMSGGVAYVYDEDGHFAARCNTAMVALDKVLPQAEQAASGDAAGWHKGQADEVHAEEADRGPPPLDRQPARARHPRPLGRGARASSSRSSRTSTSARWRKRSAEKAVRGHASARRAARAPSTAAAK